MPAAELRRRFHAALFDALCVIGRPIGGLRPRRIYHWLARRAFETPTYRWYRNRWGCELYLSPYYDIDRCIIAFGSYEQDLHEFVARFVQPGMVCLDVGANLGEVTMHMAQRTGPSGIVVAYEPIPPVRARLEMHVTRNALEGVVRVESLALSDGEGQISMGYANVTEPNQGMGSLVRVENQATSLRIDVATQTLDARIAALGLTRVDLIKIDVQGAEPLVLAGAHRTLSQFSPDLLMEVSPEDLRFAGADSRTLCAAVEALGYSVFELRDGVPNRPLRSTEISPDFVASNVYCTRRPR